MGRKMGWSEGKSCSAARRMIDSWLAGGLRWRLQRAALVRHLRRCKSCRAYAAAVRRVPRFLRECVPVRAKPELAEQIKATCLAEMYAAGFAQQQRPMRRAVGLAAAGALAAACVLAVVLVRPPASAGRADLPPVGENVARAAQAVAEVRPEPTRPAPPAEQQGERQAKRVQIARAVPSKPARPVRRRPPRQADSAVEWWDVVPIAASGQPLPQAHRSSQPPTSQPAAPEAPRANADSREPEPAGIEPDWPEDIGLDEMMVSEEGAVADSAAEQQSDEELAPAVAPQLVAGVLASAVVEHYLASAVAEEGARLALASISAPTGEEAGDAQDSSDSTGGGAGN